MRLLFLMEVVFLRNSRIQGNLRQALGNPFEFLGLRTSKLDLYPRHDDSFKEFYIWDVCTLRLVDASGNLGIQLVFICAFWEKHHIWNDWGNLWKRKWKGLIWGGTHIHVWRLAAKFICKTIFYEFWGGAHMENIWKEVISPYKWRIYLRSRTSRVEGTTKTHGSLAMGQGQIHIGPNVG